MYHVSAQGVDERMINVHYYYYYYKYDNNNNDDNKNNKVTRFSNPQKQLTKLYERPAGTANN